MSVIISSRNEKELTLVREVMEAGLNVLKNSEEKKEELRSRGIPHDMVVYYHKLDDKSKRGKPVTLK